MSQKKSKSIPAATAVEEIQPDPHNIVKLEAEKWVPQEQRDQFETLAQAAAMPAEAAQQRYLEEKKKLEPIREKAAALLAQFNEIKREHGDYLRKTGRFIDMDLPGLRRAGAPANLTNDVLTLYQQVTESLAAMTRQAADVAPALDALGPRDLEPANRGRSVWVKSYYGTTGIESGPQSILDRICRFRKLWRVISGNSGRSRGW